MKKLNLKQLGIFCMLLFLAFPVLSKAEVIKVRVILTNSNVRLEPETNSMILVTVPVGTELEMVEKAGEWFKVKLPPDEEGFEVTGYIHGSMVEVVIEKGSEEKQVIQPRKEVVPTEKPVSQQPRISRGRQRQRKTSGMEVGFKLCGSGSYFYPNDLNDTLKTEFDYWNDRAQENPDSTMQGEYNPLNIGYGGGVEVFVNFIPQFGIGVGVGYIHASTQMTYDYSGAFTSQEVAISPKITSLPITFSLYFGVPLGRVVKIFALGGVGYYLTKFNWSSIHNYFQLGETADYLNDFSMKENNIGFHGGLGMELSVSRSLAIVIEAAGRYVKLMDLQGTSTKKYIFNDEIKRDESYGNLFLWYADYERDGKWYPSLSFDEEKPSGEDARNIRKGIIALTGYRVQIGFKIKFSTFSKRDNEYY